jgi:hypothetical protein
VIDVVVVKEAVGFSVGSFAHMLVSLLGQHDVIINRQNLRLTTLIDTY